MDVTSAITLMDFIGKVGIPFVVTCGVLFIVWKIGNTIPSSIKSFVSTITEQEKKQQAYYRERQKQYDEQMQVIITVAQQGVEAQKRGNEIIERNNIIMEAQQRSNDKLMIALENLSDQCCRAEEATHENRETANKVYTEIVRIAERVK